MNKILLDGTMALTRNTKQIDSRVWDKIKRGEYRIVYASPEIILNKRGQFLGSVVSSKNKFMENLVAVAVDEAHLIWDWVGFRDKFQLLGTLRLVLNNVPWVLLSATLSPMIAAYTHEVCNLQRHTIRFIRSCSRDNIDLTVCPITTPRNLTPLLDLIGIDIARGPLAIRKIVIFYDGIEGGQRIADALRSKIQPALAAKYNPRTLVQMFFGTLDELKKKQTLSDLQAGTCRIVICTDAFGLGVDISNIDWVIQWNVDKKVPDLAVVSLMGKVSISALTQRAGRAARNDYMIGKAIFFVPKAILEAVPKDWEDGWEAKPSARPGICHH